VRQCLRDALGVNKPIYFTLAADKTFCRITALILLVLSGWAFNARAQTLTNLRSFTPTDGFGPHSLLQGRDGNFYGTAGSGGNLNLNNGSGWGTVFRITPTGLLTNLHSFILTDGGEPNLLVQGSDGNFYGTTYTNTPGGLGTVFKMTSTGSITTLWLFGLNPGIDSAASHPVAGLVQGADGNFYGTTSAGGANGDGIVFRITPTGTLTNLHNFNGADGANSQWGSLVPGNDGNFYGVTSGGGTNSQGNIYRISPTGNFTNLYSFSGTDGQFPEAGLVLGSDGNFYGITSSGGTNNGGTIFRMTPTGVLTNLHLFAGVTDGHTPTALVQGSDGNFYGTTRQGGGSTHCFDGCGTIFRITPSGTFTNLCSIDATNVASPVVGFVQGSDGNFYGTAFLVSYPFVDNIGDIFKLTVPLNPPANQVSVIQTTGNDVVVSIPSVATETYQLQVSNSLNPTNWVNVPGAAVTNCIGALLTLTNSGGATGPQGFYRFDIIP